jgi:hypothetical protein
LAAEVKPADGGLTPSPDDAPALAVQPLNQPVERGDRDTMLGKADSFGPALANFATAPGWEPPFAFRLGIPERPADPSPRQALNEVLRT